MAELYEIVGAVLRDIAQARVSSDIYSRDASRYYEQDPLLRRFPVPRTEIDEVELTLRFAVAGVEIDPLGHAGYEVSTATVFTRYSYDLTAKVFNILINAIREEPDLDPDAREDVLNTLYGGVFRINLQQDTLRLFERNQGHLIDDGRLNEEELKKRVGVLILETVDDLLSPHFPADTVEKLRKNVASSGALEGQITSLQKAIHAALAGKGNCKVNVDVTADVLRETPETATSELKVKATVRNYTWSQVDERDGRIWRALSPE